MKYNACAGTTREIAPTPLLLRGGDAVVMAGEARRCFHGVPRVLPAAPLIGEQLGPFAEAMRINISIRCAS
jgi:alkylated DNA repair dioxygenase AlkB